METENPSTLHEGASARQTLMQHWSRSAALLTELSERSESRFPLNNKTIFPPDFERKAEEHKKEGERLVAQIRRIGSYLGHEWKPPHPSAIGAARLIRANIQNGDSDEAIAFFLEAWRKPSRKRGRPTGSNDSDGVALRAIELRESDPTNWPWPKVADELCEHREDHAPHAWNSTCTESIKASVQRLRDLLQDLQSQETTPAAR